MDILYVGTLSPHPGGSAIVGDQLVPGLAALGHRVRALAALAPEAERVFEREHPEVPVTRYPVPYFNVTSNQIPEAYRALESAAIRAHLEPLLADDPPDVVIAGRENLAPPVFQSAQAAGVRSALIVHTEGGGGLFKGVIAGPALDDLVAAYRGLDLMVVVAPHLRERYLDYNRNVVAIDNGVDMALFAPGPRPAALAERWGIPSDDIVVAHVSNLKDLKRPMDLIESAGQALAAQPTLRYLIVGEGVLREPMAARAQELGIADRVTFTGWVSHHQVAEYLRLADMVVMPSDTEALCLLHLETLASGRVLLASDITASRYVVHDGVDGLLFQVGDVPAITALTLRVARDLELRERLGRAGRQRAESFGLPHVVEQYAAALQAICR